MRVCVWHSFFKCDSIVIYQLPTSFLPSAHIDQSPKEKFMSIALIRYGWISKLQPLKRYTKSKHNIIKSETISWIEKFDMEQKESFVSCSRPLIYVICIYLRIGAEIVAMQIYSRCFPTVLDGKILCVLCVVVSKHER